MRTTEEIYRELLAAFQERSGYGAEDSCDLAVRLYAVAAQVQALECQADWVLDQSFPQTAQGAYLDNHAAMRGISRQVATKAVGTLRFSVADAPVGDLSISQGSVCMTESGVRFQTTQAAVLAAGKLAADVGRARGIGTVDVYIATAAGAPDNALLKEVETDLQAKREIAVDVQVRSPTQSSVNVAVELDVGENGNFAAVKSAVESAVAGWFTGKLLGSAILLAELGRLIYAVSGVKNYHILTPDADTAGSSTILPTLGVLTVTEMEA